MAQFIFNANDVEPADDFELIPVGDYKAMITESQFKDTTANPANKYLSIKLQIIDGKYKNRLLFDNLNLIRSGNSEKDQTTVRIAQQRLSSICRAVGKMNIKDSGELHNKPLCITVGIQAATGKYGESNTIKAYKSINGGNTLPQQQTAPAETENTDEPASWEEFIGD